MTSRHNTEMWKCWSAIVKRNSYVKTSGISIDALKPIILWVHDRTKNIPIFQAHSIHTQICAQRNTFAHFFGTTKFISTNRIGVYPNCKNPTEQCKSNRLCCKVKVVDKLHSGEEDLSAWNPNVAVIIVEIAPKPGEPSFVGHPPSCTISRKRCDIVSLQNYKGSNVIVVRRRVRNRQNYVSGDKSTAVIKVYFKIIIKVCAVVYLHVYWTCTF